MAPEAVCLTSQRPRPCAAISSAGQRHRRRRDAQSQRPRPCAAISSGEPEGDLKYIVASQRPRPCAAISSVELELREVSLSESQRPRPCAAISRTTAPARRVQLLQVAASKALRSHFEPPTVAFRAGVNASRSVQGPAQPFRGRRRGPCGPASPTSQRPRPCAAISARSRSRPSRSCQARRSVQGPAQPFRAHTFRRPRARGRRVAASKALRSHFELPDTSTS